MDYGLEFSGFINILGDVSEDGNYFKIMIIRLV